MRMKVVDWRC